MMMSPRSGAFEGILKVKYKPFSISLTPFQGQGRTKNGSAYFDLLCYHDVFSKSMFKFFFNMAWNAGKTKNLGKI